MTDAESIVPVPLLTVTRGTPTPEELAALVVVLASQPTVPAGGGRASRSEWAAKSRTLRPQMHPGQGAWRASALPG